MLGPAVNRQPGFRRGLVEQSNAPKNTFCCKLAAAATWLPTCLVSWLAMRLAAVCRPCCRLGSLAASVCLSVELAGLARWLICAGWRSLAPTWNAAGYRLLALADAGRRADCC